jgi:spermidine/putrescine transport system substrate-binding protein
MTKFKKIGTTRGNYTRRDFLKGMGVGALSLAASPLLAACAQAAEELATTPEEMALTGPLNFSNWPFYIDEQTNSDFESEFGVSVNYIEDINDNEEFFAVMQPLLSAGEDPGRDIIVLTDWMVSRFINLGWLEELDKSKIPNAELLRDGLRNVAFDPNRDYSLPWQSGFTAIGYNPTLTGRKLTSLTEIFDPAFAGRVTMLSEMRDTLGLTMLGLGLDPATATVEDAEAAVAKIKENIDNGHIRRFTGNDYGTELTTGDAWVSYAWSGDVIQLQLDNPDLEWLFPEEGFMLWSDNMLIPKGAQNKATAEAYMDFVYRPEIQAQIEAFVWFIPPVKHDLVKEEITKIEETPGELSENPLIFPTQEDLANAHIFKPLAEDEEAQMIELFESVALDLY